MSWAAIGAVLLAVGQAAEPAAQPPEPPPAEAPPPPNDGQVAGPDSDAPAATTDTGTLVFQPSFFAEARPNTANDMVARVPGFAVSQNTSVRGFSGSVGNVLIDGARPASKNEALTDILNRIPATEVERIELIRGAPGVDMQGFSQLVNVIRRRTASRQHVFTAGATVYTEDGRFTPTLRYELNGRNGDRTYEFSVGTVTSNSDSSGVARLVRVEPDGDVIRDVSQLVEADGTGLSGRARLQQPFAGGIVELSANLGRFDFKIEQNTTSAAFNQSFAESFDDTNGEASARYERPFSPRLRGEFRGIQRLALREGRQVVLGDGPDGRFAYENLTGESILRGSLRFTQSPTLTWEAGIEGAYNFLDADQSYVQDGTPIPLPSDQVLVEELRGEGFVTAAWRVRENLTVDAAMRLEVSRISQSGAFEQSRDFVYPKARLLTTWSITPVDQIRVRVEHEVAQLDFGDFAASAELAEEQVQAGAIDLRPDQTTTFEAAYERRFWGDGVLTATASYGLITDAIDNVPVFLENGSVLAAVGNIGDGSFYAFVIDTTIPTDRLGVSGGRLRLRGSWVEIDVTDPLTGQTRRPSGNSPFIPLIGFTQDIASLRTNWGVEYRWGNYSESFQIVETNRQEVTDVASGFLEYKPWPDTSFRFQFNYIGAIDNTRVFYTGPRDSSPVSYVERRALDPEARVFFRVRRTF